MESEKSTDLSVRLRRQYVTLLIVSFAMMIGVAGTEPSGSFSWVSPWLPLWDAVVGTSFAVRENSGL